MGTSEQNLYYLLYDRDYYQGKVDSWDFEKFRKWRNDLQKTMQFDTIIKSPNKEVRSVYLEEFEEQGNLIKKTLEFIKLDVEDKTKPLFLIKDIELSRLPHNLILNKNNEFIALQRAVVNIMSLDWLDKAVNEVYLPVDFSKSIWIPTEARDFVIEQLYSKLEDCLIAENFFINQKSVVETPLNSNVSIICSHGDIEISRFNSFYQNADQSLHVSENIVSKGDVLVLFVCHSGSMKEDFFRNQIDSLIRYYFEIGFKAIIAPFWALHLYIPSIWLPVFLEKLKNGENIANAVFYANKGVYDNYPTPAAWACMHLYGNGNLKVGY